MKKHREHINLVITRSGSLLDGFKLTVDRVNGLAEAEALVGSSLDTVLDHLRGEGWQVAGAPPSKHGRAKQVRLYLYRDAAVQRSVLSVPTREALEQRDEARQQQKKDARRAMRDLRERFLDREPTPEEYEALSTEDRQRLAALRLMKRGLR